MSDRITATICPLHERLGFRVSAVREGAVTESRKLKPTIPLVDQSGVPVTDEIELERSL